MDHTLGRALRGPCIGTLTVALLCCGSGDIAFSPQLDAAALARIERRWTGSVGEVPFSLSLCEDEGANAAVNVDGCTYAHLVRSNEPEAARTIERASSSGCSGCFLGVFTNVTASVTTASGQALAAKGQVALGSTFDEDPYLGDYGLLLYADDGSLLMEGRIQSDGTLLLSGTSLMDVRLGYVPTESEVSLTQHEAACGVDETPTDPSQQEGDAARSEDQSAI